MAGRGAVPTATSRVPSAGPYVVVFVVALAARVGSVLFRGGYGGTFNYDSGVYFTAADALIHGRLPYRDFTLVHPPGSMLVLTPFAALGRVTSDHTGFVVACVAFAVLGALAAVVVMPIVRQLVPSRLAMWAGGLAYATYPGAVTAEFEPRLEPLANLLLLVGLLCLLRSGRSRWWVAALGGAALTASVSVKIWYVVPAVVVAAGYLTATRRHRAGAALFGVVVAGLAIDGPFFAAAPRAMVRDVVLDQLGRPEVRGGYLLRLTRLSGYDALSTPTYVTYPVHDLAAVLAAVVLLALIVLTAVPRGARIVAAMLALQVIVLLQSPTFFHFYADYLTPAAAVCAGVSVGVIATAVRRRTALRALSVPARRRLRGVAGAVLVVVASVALASAVATDGAASSPYPSQLFARAASGARCIVSDNPQTLIRLDALSRGLADGCPNWVDVQGHRLDTDRYRLGADGSSDRWRRDLARYLVSGDLVAFVAPQPNFLSPRLVEVLRHAPLRKRLGRLCLITITAEQRRQLASDVPLAPGPSSGCVGLETRPG